MVEMPHTYTIPTVGSGVRLLRGTGVVTALVMALGCTGEIAGGDDDQAGVSGGSSVPQAGQGAGGIGSGSGAAVGGGGAVSTPGGGATDGGTPPVGTAGGGSVPAPMAGDMQLEKDCASFAGNVSAGVTKLRRLTRDQFNNTVRDLIGATGKPADALAPDEKMGPFHSNAIAPITDLVVQQHQETARTLATEARARMATIAPCDLAADTGTTCATRFVTEFGLKAFRRPLDAAEVTAYVGLYNVGKAGTGGAANGFRLVLETMLQSPAFLYHSDVGASGVPQGTPSLANSYELASRISYFLWNTMPDAALFTKAAAGALAQPAAVTAEVDRMLKDDKAGATIALFHRQWLDLEELPTKTKDSTLYPNFSPAVASAMLQETSHFTDHVVRKGDGLLKTLLTSNVAFPQGELFRIYGVAQPGGYTAGTPVMLDATKRAGLLTQAAFLTRNASNNQSSPVHRGIVVRENLLCQPIPPPPPGVSTGVAVPTPATTTRQRYEQHSTDPTCASCHLLIDPVGVGFENFDAVGAYRTQDGLGMVDSTGEIAASDVAGKYSGAVELANKLAASKDVENCVVNQWFRFSLGRIETQNDACSIKSIRDGFRASGGNIRTLLAQVAVSDAFRYVRSQEK